MSDPGWTIDRVRFEDSRELAKSYPWPPDLPDGMVGIGYGKTADGRSFYGWQVFSRDLWADRGAEFCEMELRQSLRPPFEQESL